MNAHPHPAIDRFRLLAAVLVVAIHTGPVATYSAVGDFYLTRVLGRVAVPFFPLLKPLISEDINIAITQI